MTPVGETKAERKINHLLEWLADAPLYINSAQIEKFYDAVVKPENKGGKTVITSGTEDTSRLKGSGSATLGGELNSGELLAKIANLFPSIKITGNANAAIEKEGTGKTTQGKSIELFPIDNPHRQLVHLTIYYLFNQNNRLEFVKDANQPDWCNPESIVESPKKLVFIDLPSQNEAQQKSIPQVKLLPTAVEFANGKVITLFDQFQKDNGERPPAYPEIPSHVDENAPAYNLETELQKYWDWFDKMYSATNAMKIVEKAGAENGRIFWIDYRLPISNSGKTLHLHFGAAQEYTIGDLAYNLIKRGNSHGLRIIGTLKSGPGINVLAVFEK